MCLLVWVAGLLVEILGFFVATPTSSSSICLSFASNAAILAEVLLKCVCVILKLAVVQFLLYEQREGGTDEERERERER